MLAGLSHKTRIHSPSPLDMGRRLLAYGSAGLVGLLLLATLAGVVILGAQQRSCLEPQPRTTSRSRWTDLICG